jgi:hypothetical protein
MLATKEIGQGLDVRDKWEGILEAVGFAMQATVHTTTWATPMQLVFGRDAIHNVKFLADWQWFSSCAFSCEASEVPEAPLPIHLDPLRCPGEGMAHAMMLQSHETSSDQPLQMVPRLPSSCHQTWLHCLCQNLRFPGMHGSSGDALQIPLEFIDQPL